MSDFIDETDPTEPTADSSAPMESIPPEDTAVDSAPPHGEGLVAHGKGVVSADPFAPPAQSAFGGDETATFSWEASESETSDAAPSEPLRPLDTDLEPTASEAAFETSIGDSGSRVEPYRPTLPVEPAVRPLEPIRSSLEPTEPIERTTPVPPPQRVHYYPEPQAAAPESPARWPMALLAFGSGLLGGLIVLGTLFLTGAFDSEPAPSSTTAQAVAITTPPPETVPTPDPLPAGEPGVATDVGIKVVPSIVTVEVGTGDAIDSFQAFGSGSGVVLTEDGLILTNHHVVDGAATRRVIFQNGLIYEATLIGSDELTDLAVLSIEATGLTPIELGSTENLRIGDRAIAVGNPLGLAGGASLTVGVVSAFDREVRTGDNTPLFGMLQTDAPITNGSSGGALVDSNGRLIGITTAIGVSQAGAEGIGFATPVEVVKRIASQIIETGEVAHPFLGVQLRTRFDIQADGGAVPNGTVIVAYADDQSAAAEAGLEIQDVIIAINGNRVRTQNDVISGIRSAQVGEVITVQVDRDGEILTFEITLGERPPGT